MAPRRPSPLNRTFAKPPSLKRFFSIVVPIQNQGRVGRGLARRSSLGTRQSSRPRRPASAAPVGGASGQEAALQERCCSARRRGRRRPLPLLLLATPLLIPAAPLLLSSSSYSRSSRPLPLLRSSSPLLLPAALLCRCLKLLLASYSASLGSSYSSYLLLNHVLCRAWVPWLLTDHPKSSGSNAYCKIQLW
jgi:hypothetical protein